MSEQPEIEATLTIKLRGELANVEALADLTAALDELLAARYAAYRGVNVKLDVMAADMAPVDQAAAERIAREQGIIP
jgi:hypothetical protein